jgi:malonyl-ACP decarboxylase
MVSCLRPDIGITGLGITSAIGQGRAAFADALLSGQARFGVMQRPGRQLPIADAAQGSAEPPSAYIGAEIPTLSLPARVSRATLRTSSFAAQVALATLQEAWDEAQLQTMDPARIGLIVGGSNFQQRELSQSHETYRQRIQFLRPNYAVQFMDTDLCGVCTEFFAIRGLAHTVGGASASGQLAVIQAAQAVASGDVDVCIALGALMDLSFWECQAFRSLGAMGSTRHAHEPQLAARPFDRDRDGFIYGECCGAVVVERLDTAPRSRVVPYARICGSAVRMDANRNPDPSLEGEVRTIQAALRQSGLSPRSIDYINPHGSGSERGDATEVRAIGECDLGHAWVNATKSLTGHGLSAAGAVEIVATLLQMRAGRLHPTRNLLNPIDPSLRWVGERSVSHSIQHALSISIGFGGINTAVCLQHLG